MTSRPAGRIGAVNAINLELTLATATVSADGSPVVLTAHLLASSLTPPDFLFALDFMAQAADHFDTLLSDPFRPTPADLTHPLQVAANQSVRRRDLKPGLPIAKQANRSTLGSASGTVDNAPPGGAMNDSTHRQAADPPAGPTDSNSANRWPHKRFHPSRAQRVANALVTVLAEWGAVPHTYVMTTRGRKTGVLHSLPVTLVETGGQKWLVAPYGPVAWVLNARAAGRVTLRRRGRVGMYAAQEVPFAKAGPVLKDYLQIAGATRPYFRATVDSPVADFAAEAAAHPVFALTLVNGPGAR